MTDDGFLWVDSPEPSHSVDTVCVENANGPDELCLFEIGTETSHFAWVTALEGSYVDLESMR